MSSIFDGIGDDGVEQLDENLHKWFKEKWVRFGPDGKIRGACARGDDSEGKPKCLPQKKAQNLGKKGRKYAASKKRREDPNPERRGKAKNVATKKKTNEDIPFNECPSCRGPIVHESMLNEKQDACYHKVKSRYKVWPSAYASGALVQCRKKGASNWGTGGKKNESNIMKGIVDESESVLVLYIDGKPSAKYAIGHEAKTAMERLQAKFPNRQFELKRETRGGIGGNKKVDEAKAKPYVKPFIENGKQVGWKSSDGYHVKYWQMFAKDSAIKHAKISPAEVDEGIDWQRGENNDQHDHTISDAEEYLAHIYPVVKKYMVRRAEVGFRANDKQFLKSMSHMKDVDGIIKHLGLTKLPTMSGSKQVSPSIGYTWTTFLSPNKKAAITYYQDRGMGQDMIYIAAIDKILHRKIYDVFVDAGVIVGRDKKLPEPNLPDAMRVSNTTDRDEAFKKAMDKFYGKTDDKDVTEDYTGEFAAEKTPAINPYGGLKDNQFRGAISEEPTTSGPIGTQPGGWRKYKPKPAGEIDEAKKSEFRLKTEQQQYDKLEKIKNSLLPHWAKEYLILLNDPKGKVFKAAYYSFPKGQDAREEAAQYIMNKYKVPQEMIDKVKHGEMEHMARERPEDRTYDFDVPSVHEDTAYAGGMGQGGNAGQSYRKFKPKSAGTFKEDELDEACWKGYHKEGNKKMFGKTYPNCVKNTNEEEQLDESFMQVSRINRVLKKHGFELYNDNMQGDHDNSVIRAEWHHPSGRKISTFTPNVGGGLLGNTYPSTYISVKLHGNGGMDEYKESTAEFLPTSPRELNRYLSSNNSSKVELDEKCWDSHKQVGMKNKGGKQVPNCVPKESAIMKGLKSL
jgi:hypothetical protein